MLLKINRCLKDAYEMIQNWFGDNVRSSVPIYSVRLKAFDLF